MDHSKPVVVDGIAIVGSNFGVGHRKVDTLEKAFVSQHAFYPEHNMAVHWRWHLILEHLPAVRQRHLYEDLSDIFRVVEDGPAGMGLFAAYDLAILQHRFWEILQQNGMTLPGPLAWHSVNCQVWQRKLLDRIETQKPWRRNKFGKIKKPVSAPKSDKPGKWQH